MSFSTLFSDKLIPYTGKELRPHFALSQLGLRGSGIVAFLGPCRVETAELVDWEDRLENERIEARLMVHFIGEFFGVSLREAVLAQRLLVATVAESLNEKLSPGKPFLRTGNDLHLGDRKLSVSIVTSSPVSQLLHLGINIDPTGAPVSAVGLQEFFPDQAHITEWVRQILQAFSKEMEGVEWACTKVRPVV